MNRIIANEKLVVAIGGSAGSIQALTTILAGLPRDFDAMLLVAIHRPYGRKSLLPAILRRATHLRVFEPTDSEALTSPVGHISRPSEHLSIRGDGYCAKRLPDPYWLRRNKSIDELFTSVAKVAGVNSVGVLLSGLMSDGKKGLKAIKRAGGTTILQDPADADYSSMPRHALESGAAEYVLPHRHIAPALAEVWAEHTAGVSSTQEVVRP